MHSEQDISRVDRNRLYGIYRSWPEYFREAVKIAYPSEQICKHYKCIIFAGMGGSATSSDVLKSIVDHYGNLPSASLRGEFMPSYVDEESLVVVSSISGNTKESLLMMKKALERKASVICISSGGQLKDAVDQVDNNLICNHISIPNLLVPRASLPYLLVAGLSIISNFLHKISIHHEIETLSRSLDDLFEVNSIDVPEEHNLSKKIARFFLHGRAFCYSSPTLMPAAVRFKNSLNENAKIHCISDSILEASHNDIVPFTFNHINEFPKILQLRWRYDDSFTNERFEKVKILFKRVVQPVMEVSIAESSLLGAIVSAIFILDLATIYIAFTNRIDPSPTPAIDVLKDL